MCLHPRRIILGLILAGSFWTMPVRGAEIDKFLPDDTQLVLSINVRQILDSPLVQKHVLEVVKQKLKSSFEVQQYLEPLGLDLLKDFSSITLASPGSADKEKATIIVRGSFDLAKIHALADQASQADSEKLKIHKQGNIRIYEGKSPNAPTAIFAAFLNKETVVVTTSKSYLDEAIGISEGKKGGKISKDLQALIGKLNDKQSLWLAVVATKEVKDLLARNPQAKQLSEKLEAFSGGITLADDIKLNFRIQTNDAKAAATMRQQMEAVKGIVTFMVSGNEEIKDLAPDILDALNNFKFSQDQGTVGLDITIPAALIEKGIDKAKKLQ